MRHTSARAARVGRLVVLALVVGTVAVGCAGGDDGATSGTTAPPPPVETVPTTEVPLEAGTQLATYNPSVGDCFDKRKVTGQAGKQTEIVLKLDCTLPHDNEVFALAEWPAPNWNDPVPASRAYPGDEALRKLAKAECAKAFSAYVGQRYELSRLEMGFLLPAESTWPSARRIGCYLFDPAEKKLEGSQRDSRA